MNEIKLTASDLDLIRVVQKDARLPISLMARELGIPESTARNKLKRLETLGVLNFSVVTDPLKLGYNIWVIMMIDVALSEIRSASAALTAFPDVYFVAITAGRYNIQVSAVFPSNTDFLQFLSERISRINGIKAIHSHTVLSVEKRQMAKIPPP